MKIEDFVVLNNEPTSDVEITQFEQEYALTIPTQYKELLKLSNGVDVTGMFRHPLHHDPDWKVTIYSRLASIAGLRDGFLMLKHLNSAGVSYQYQDKILNIGGTQDGAHIMLGYDEPITGKVFIDDQSETTDESKIALFLVANNLIEFLAMLEPFPEK